MRSSRMVCSMVIHSSSHSSEEIILNPDLFPHLQKGDYIEVYPYDVPVSLEKGRDRAKSSDTDGSDHDPDRTQHIHNRLIFRVPTMQPTAGRLEISICKTVADPLGFKPFTKVMVEQITESEAGLEFLELVFKRQYLQRGNMWRFKNQMFGRPVHLGQNIAINGMQAQIQELRIETMSMNTSSGIITKNTKFVFRSRSSRIIWLLQISAEMWDFDRNGVLYFEKFMQDFVSPLFDSWKQLEIDKVKLMRKLRQEFFSYPHSVGWKTAVDDPNPPLENTGKSCSVRFAVPSDSVNGNFLEAINTTLNLLDKHYMDRDLQRTGNSIVMISAGAGIFKVKSNLAQISKQRMLDGGIGIDFISLARPLVHAVPLFFVDCRSHNMSDFYEMPHWIRVSYIDINTKSAQRPVDTRADELTDADEEDDPVTNLTKSPQSSRLTSILTHANDHLKTLAADYVAALPITLKSTITNSAVDLETYTPSSATSEGKSNLFSKDSNTNNISFPTWGKVYNLDTSQANKVSSPLGYKSVKKGVLLRKDLLCFDSSKGKDSVKKTFDGHAEDNDLPLLKREGESLADSFVAVSTLASLTMRETSSAPKLEEPSSKLPHSSGENPMISSSTVKSSEGPIDRNEEVSESPGRVSVSRIDLLRDMNALFSGTYVKDSTKDAKKSERDILCDLMNSFDLPFHRPRTDSANDSGPSTIGGSVTSQSRSTNPDSSHTNHSSFHSNRSPSSSAVSQSSSESKESGHASQYLGKKPTMMTNTPSNTLVNSVTVKSSTSSNSNSNSNSSAMESTTISKQLSVSQSNPGVTSKVPLRLSSKNFATKSLNQGAALPITDRNGKVVAGGDGGTKWTFVRGKVVPLVDKKVDSRPVGAVAQSLCRAEMIQKYCQKNCINPFKLKEAESYLRSLTPNRRRWSHVSPAGKNWKVLDYGSDFGLNWKSLTQPAILPMNSDVLPVPSDLKSKYNVQSYSLLNSDSAASFLSPADMICEMICQRLTQEYQLIELTESGDLSSYHSLMSNNSGFGGIGSALKFRQSENFFVLSMGHRIQLIHYDPVGHEISVKIYRSEHGENKEDDESIFTYKYELWVPQLGQFQTVTQTFYQFPNPEFKWNQLDNVLAGSLSYGGIDDGTKPKRLRFSVIPDCRIATASDVDEYFAKIDRLLEFVNKYGQAAATSTVLTSPVPSPAGSSGSSGSGSGSREQMILQKDRSLPPSSNLDENVRSGSLHRVFAARDFEFMKLTLRVAKNGNPNWLYLKYDKNICAHKAYHMEFHWLVCDSWLIDEFVTTLYRKSIKWGLRICQIPEYFSSGNLNVHPFRSMPQIPFIPIEHPPLIRIIELLYLTRENGWLLDNEHKTDWAGMGLPNPNYDERDNDQFLSIFMAAETATSESVPSPAGRPDPQSTDLTVDVASPATPSGALATISQSIRRLGDNLFPSPFSNTKSASNPTKAAPSKFLPSVPTSSSGIGGVSDKKRLDRQYIHCYGLAAVRLAAHGFVWLLNSATRISDANNMSNEEKTELAMKKMSELNEYCSLVVDTHRLLWDIVDNAMQTSDKKVVQI
eukprot:gene22546-30811_t